MMENSYSPGGPEYAGVPPRHRRVENDELPRPERRVAKMRDQRVRRLELKMRRHVVVVVVGSRTHLLRRTAVVDVTREEVVIGMAAATRRRRGRAPDRGVQIESGKVAIVVLVVEIAEFCHLRSGGGARRRRGRRERNRCPATTTKWKEGRGKEQREDVSSAQEEEG
jgi:hypothetical protein